LRWIGAASGRRKSEEPPLLLPIVRQIPGEHDEPCGRQRDGLLADQDRANDFMSYVDGPDWQVFFLTL